MEQLARPRVPYDNDRVAIDTIDFEISFCWLTKIAWSITHALLPLETGIKCRHITQLHNKG